MKLWAGLQLHVGPKKAVTGMLECMHSQSKEKTSQMEAGMKELLLGSQLLTAVGAPIVARLAFVGCTGCTVSQCFLTTWESDFIFS